MGEQQQTIFPTVAGILIMISGCLVITYDVFIRPRSSLLLLEVSQRSIPVGAGVLALIGGILCLNRTSLMMATIGGVFILPDSLSAWPRYLSYQIMVPGELPSFVYIDLLVHTTTIVLSLISLSFIAVSKSEFS